jgi:hypothetical protein
VAITNNNNFGGLASEKERQGRMTRFSLSKVLGVALGCAALVLGGISVNAAKSALKSSTTEITANAGTTFVLTQTPTNATLFTHTVDGVAQVSNVGNCTVHFNLLVTAMSATLFEINGTWAITNANATTTLNADVVGFGTIDPDNANMLNIHYELEFTGGTGAFAGASGLAELNGFGLFTTQGLVQPTGVYATGKATWTMKGTVVKAN